RQQRFVPQELSRTRLRGGDVLVLSGRDDGLERISADRNFLMMVPFQAETKEPRKELLAAAIMAGTIALAAFNVVTLAMAALTGAVAMVLSRCVTINQAYRAIDQRMFLFSA